MKRVKVIKGNTKAYRPVVLADFAEAKAKPDSMMPKITKKQIKAHAKSLGLAYDDAMVSFAKKVLNHWMKENIKR